VHKEEHTSIRADMWRSATTNPAHDQVPLRPLHSWKDAVCALFEMKRTLATISIDLVGASTSIVLVADLDLAVFHAGGRENSSQLRHIILELLLCKV
jgi:hypothetical protein